MTLSEIKEAIRSGDRVFWKQSNYEVIQDSIGQFLIRCSNNGDCIGLSSRDGVLNGSEAEFYKEQ